jgi:heme oxygenase
VLIEGSNATGNSGSPEAGVISRPGRRQPDIMRQRLRAATHDIHERLHRQPALAAVQDGTIDRDAYRRLLARLYGFHIGFERAARIKPERSVWLERDLAALGIKPERLAALSLCRGFPTMALPEALLGALYVVEGSALGGVALARGLDGVLGVGVPDGRRFFTGHKSETGSAWRAYLARLSATAHTAEQQATIISTAIATFALFECWLGGWNDNDD